MPSWLEEVNEMWHSILQDVSDHDRFLVTFPFWCSRKKRELDLWKGMGIHPLGIYEGNTWSSTLVSLELHRSNYSHCSSLGWCTNQVNRSDRFMKKIYSISTSVGLKLILERANPRLWYCHMNCINKWYHKILIEFFNSPKDFKTHGGIHFGNL